MTQQLPAAIEAEKSILGGLILDNSLWNEAGSGLAPEDFYLDAHRKIFAAIGELSEQGKPVDYLTISQHLGREVEQIGGVAYLSTLTSGVPRRGSLTHYVSIVRDKALLRGLVHAANGAMALAMEETTPAAEIVRQVQDAFTGLAMRSVETDRDIFVDVTEFCAGPDEQPDWLVEGLIERGSNGIAAADPKGAKSLTFAAYLSVCLALGVPWLDLDIKKRTRVAVVSREDNPATTKRRIKQVVKGKGFTIEELSGWLHINSKKQSPSLMLDNPREVNNLIRCIQRWQSEFVILDVFNKMHSQDENDNTKVRLVMNQIDRIHSETGAQICVLHHWNKGDSNQSITRRVRGAGAIAGFAEWIAGIEVVDEVQKIRKMSFETKVGDAPKPIFYKVIDQDFGTSIKFEIGEPA